MPVKRQILHPDGIYFITFTCFKWLPLIEKTNGHRFIYNWFNHLKSKGHFISGYVIMPNHIHVLIGFRNTDQSMNVIIGNGKRFIAYEIIKELERQRDLKLLQLLKKAVKLTDRIRNKKHEVWEDSFDWKECRNHKFMRQKLDYIHGNPCRGKWNLSVSPAEYEHSSARFYHSGVHAAYPVTDFMELDDVDLTKPDAEATLH